MLFGSDPPENCCGQTRQSGVSAYAELCTHARQLGLVGEAVAAEQVLAERKGKARQQLGHAAAHSSAEDYKSALATAQAAAVEAAVLSQGAEVYTVRCRDAVAALAAAAAQECWAVFDSSRRAALELDQDCASAEAQMQARRDAASAAVSSALQACLQELNFCNSQQPRTSGQRSDSPSPFMHCSACSSKDQEQQVQQLVAKSAMASMPRHTAVDKSMWLPHASQITALDAFVDQLSCLVSQSTNAVLSGDGNSGKWQHALQQLVQALKTWQCSHTTTSVGSTGLLPLGSKTGVGEPAALTSTSHGNAEALSAALATARHVGLFQTVQLALQVLLKHVQMAQQAQQGTTPMVMPTAQQAQDCTAAWGKAQSDARGAPHVSCPSMPALPVLHHQAGNSQPLGNPECIWVSSAEGPQACSQIDDRRALQEEAADCQMAQQLVSGRLLCHACNSMCCTDMYCNAISADACIPSTLNEAGTDWRSSVSFGSSCCSWVILGNRTPAMVCTIQPQS